MTQRAVLMESRPRNRGYTLSLQAFGPSVVFYIPILLKEILWKDAQAETLEFIDRELGLHYSGLLCWSENQCLSSSFFNRKINAYLTNGVCFVDLSFQCMGPTMEGSKYIHSLVIKYKGPLK